jgi:hypothetical protein
MESLVNFDLEMYPDILDMLDGVSVGDTVTVSGSFQVKELTDKRFSASFNDEDVSITRIGGDDTEDEDDTDDTDEEEPEAEETAG